MKRRVIISLLHLLHFLASELGQALDDILPGLITISERLDCLQDLILTGADLAGAVTVTQGDAVVLNGLEVDSDTEGGTKLVVTSVTLTDTGGRVVNTVGDTKTAQLSGKVLDQGLEGRVGGQRNQQNLGGGNGGREGQNLVKSQYNDKKKRAKLESNGMKLTPRASSPARDQ